MLGILLRKSGKHKTLKILLIVFIALLLIGVGAILL